jgi:hypothetical protein
MLPWLLLLLSFGRIVLSAFVPPKSRGYLGHSHYCALNARVEQTTTTTSSSSSSSTQIQEKSDKVKGDDSISRRASWVTNAAYPAARRDFGQKFLVAFALVVVSPSLSRPLPAFAAATTDMSLEQDKENIVKGYKRLNYLLDNWEKETSFCGTDIDPFTGKRKCERTPTIVMDYMGYKSIKDPLFKAEKTLRRLAEALAPSNREADLLFEAVEKWNAAADEANTMAYTSSWAGPQNPNGGDDNIEYYLDRAKLQVITARNVLKDVIDILGLSKA